MTKRGTVAKNTMVIVHNYSIPGLSFSLYLPEQDYFIPENGKVEVHSFEEVMQKLLEKYPDKIETFIELCFKEPKRYGVYNNSKVKSIG